MNLILGILAGAIAASGYSVRLAFLKNLAGLHFSKLTLNMLYRLSSLPFLILVFFCFNAQATIIQPIFPLVFLLSAVINLFFGYFQISTISKIKFSTMEGFIFLEILFSLILGKLLLQESLTIHQLIGIGVIGLALVYGAFHEIKKGGWSYFGLAVFYNFLAALVGVANKAAVQASSPMVFAVAITVTTILVYGALARSHVSNHLRVSDQKTLWSFVAVGAITASSLVSIGFAYKFAPVAIVSVVLSMRVFLSLFLAKRKFQEVSVQHQMVSALVAVFGVLVLFI
jgi:drug/metabolite transporter (DMT)-like permease